MDCIPAAVRSEPVSQTQCERSAMLSVSELQSLCFLIDQGCTTSLARRAESGGRVLGSPPAAMGSGGALYM